MMNTCMTLRRRLIHLVLLMPLTLFLAMCLLSEPALAQDPDFSTINDPLNGRYELFTVDDLLIYRTKPLQNDTESEINNYVLETANESISSQTKRTVDTVPCFINLEQPPQQTRIGRFFALGYDVIITLSPTSNATGTNCATTDGSDNMALYIEDVQTAERFTSTVSTSAHNVAVAMDDFDLDGFDDLVILSAAEIFVATALDVDDGSQGMIFGPKTTIAKSIATKYDPTSGDFNADGLVDVAWIGDDYTIHFATVCPGDGDYVDVDGTICAGRGTLTVVVDPLQSQTTPIKVTPNMETNSFGCIRDGYALAAGQFTGEPGDGLVVFDCRRHVEDFTISAYWYEFMSDWRMEGGAAINSTNVMNVRVNQNVFAIAAPLDWFADTEQVAFAIGEGFVQECFNNQGDPGQILDEHVGVIAFSNENKLISTRITGKRSGCETRGDPFEGYPWLNGFAVGRFASIDDDPKSESEFNPQFATLLNDGSVRIYSLDAPASYIPKLVHQTSVEAALGLNQRGSVDLSNHTNWLAAGDLQGRSARLGPPSVIRLSNHSQPSVILGAPPMHVDYILPDDTTSAEWDIVNFSVIPSSYDSQYTMSRTGSNQSANTNKTSFTHATTEKSDTDVSIKPPYIPNISGSIKTSTMNKHETISNTYRFEKNEFTYDASTSTGFGDEIWYDQTSFNLYLYPVLGQTICPADNSSCSADQEQPLYVMFSGPNSSGIGPAPGATTEWYQPVHEPGNLFSYPWNEMLLKSQVESIALLSGPQHFYTDDSTQTQNLSWSAGSGQDVTTGSVNSHSHEKGYSLTGGKIIGEILDVNLKDDIDYNDSSATSRLNQSTSSIGASQGIAIKKPGAFLDFPLYQYRVEPFIFGRTALPENVDIVTLPETVQTYGPLQAAFAANPADTLSGAWWSDSNNPYRQHIDVALNHPVRWSETSRKDALNCLQNDQDNQETYCVAFNDPNPNDLWTSEFYWMRGLFVTVDGLAGPQRAQTTAGNEVYLTARVYNYSLKDMATSSTIKVRFYRQEMDSTNPKGDSVLIDEVDVDPLPGFNSDTNPDSPNWTTASTAFDTTGLGDKTFIFWVVVWVEDSNGDMVSELAGHGLSAKPGTLTSIGDVPLAEVMLHGESRTFSNNVGYLHSLFYVAPDTQDPQPSASADELIVSNVQVSSTASVVNERIIVSAAIQASGGSADGVAVHLFHGDPDDGGRVFDAESLPHIKADEMAPISVPFRSNVCGAQEILIEARTAELTSTRQSITINVPCPPLYLPLIFEQNNAVAQ